MQRLFSNHIVKIAESQCDDRVPKAISIPKSEGGGIAEARATSGFVQKRTLLDRTNVLISPFGHILWFAPKLSSPIYATDITIDRAVSNCKVVWFQGVQ